MNIKVSVIIRLLSVCFAMRGDKGATEVAHQDACIKQ